MRLRIDPWDPEYGSSVELEPDLGPPAGLDLEIEMSGQWTSVSAPESRADRCCAFIDGVRRIDALSSIHTASTPPRFQWAEPRP